MSDSFDIASEREELERQMARTVRQPEGPQATGRCLFCDEETPHRWCDADCRDSWEKERHGRRV